MLCVLDSACACNRNSIPWERMQGGNLHRYYQHLGPLCQLPYLRSRDELSVKGEYIFSLLDDLTKWTALHVT